MGRLRGLLGRLLVYRALWSARSTTRLNLARPVRRVLAVCYGNIYRSAFLGVYLEERAKGRLEVRSTGFHPVPGRPCPDRHVAMSAKFGVDLSRHRSSRIARADLDWADLIVVMDRHNWHGLRQLRAPREKIVWAGAVTSGPLEIPDPYDMSDQALADTIERLIESGNQLEAALRSAT